jgi:hypothetical protein
VTPTPLDAEHPDRADGQPAELAPAEGVGSAEPPTARDATFPAPRAEPDTLDGAELVGTDAPADPVSSPTAPAARAGDAPQVGLHAGVNHGQMIGQLFEAVQRHSGAPLSAEYIERQLQGYLPIGNESDAQRILQKNQALVLFADRAGSGRWMAALQLLAEHQKLPTVRRIRRDPGDSFSMEGLKGHRRTGWILDLRAEDDSLPAQCDLAAQLHDVDALRADESYLIVVMSKTLRTQVGIDLDELALTPEPPNGVELFAKCLRNAEAPLAAALANEPRFTTDLLHLPPSRVVAWARTVAAAAIGYQAAVGRPLTPTDDDFTAVAAAAGSAVDGWLEELVTWHSAAGRTSYERNYLLLTAVFEGEAVPEVHKKVASLASALGEKGNAQNRWPANRVRVCSSWPGRSTQLCFLTAGSATRAPGTRRRSCATSGATDRT